MYSQCDGLEFERSSCRLDLRYVPDDQSFEGREVRDVATEVPSDYEPPDFQMKALQHTNVKLSWDDDDPTRTKARPISHWFPYDPVRDVHVDP